MDSTGSVVVVSRPNSVDVLSAAFSIYGNQVMVIDVRLDGWDR